MTGTDLRAVALDAARAGGATARRWTESGQSLGTEIKGLGDYVTAVDRAAEASIVAVLKARTPEIPVLAEEAGGERHERMWVVDPIDGTTNFMRGFHVAVGVSVGLMVEGRPSVGAVIAPYAGQEWSAAAGEGAFDHRGRRLNISAGSGQGVVATGFPFRNPERRARYLPVMETALATFEDLRRAGAASLDCANVAAGVWEGYFELGLSLWDIAAGVLLVTEAGGVATDWNGDPDGVFASGNILCGSPRWHELMLGLIEQATSRTPESA